MNDVSTAIMSRRSSATIRLSFTNKPVGTSDCSGRSHIYADKSQPDSKLISKTTYTLHHLGPVSSHYLDYLQVYLRWGLGEFFCNPAKHLEKRVIRRRRRIGILCVFVLRSVIEYFSFSRWPYRGFNPQSRERNRIQRSCFCMNNAFA